MGAAKQADPTRPVIENDWVEPDPGRVFEGEDRWRDLPTPDGDRSRKGVFVTVRLCDWEERVVLPHERTRPKPKADSSSTRKPPGASV